jgi:hypothetical protein
MILTRYLKSGEVREDIGDGVQGIKVVEGLNDQLANGVVGIQSHEYRKVMLGKTSNVQVFEGS